MNQMKQGTNGKFERRTKKNKFLKTTAVAVMACCMGLLTILSGCAPTQTNTNLEENGLVAGGSSSGVVQSAPSPLGLDPENDPVIYTTESGLEIKFGGVDLNASLSTSKLTGYPYFTLGTYNGYAINWVIIGRNSNEAVLSNSLATFLFSAWKSDNQGKVGSTQSNAYYFFNNIFESSTPAGAAINGVTPSKSYIVDKIASVKPATNTEIKSEHYLALSECTLGTTQYQTNGSGVYSTSFVKTCMTNIYNSLPSSDRTVIQKQTITQYHCGQIFTLTDQYLFPLCNYSEEYDVGRYLSSGLKIAYAIGTTTAQNWWLRSTVPNYCQAVNTAGNNTGVAPSGTCAVRPACIVKFT